jgi:hypothetical protein
MEKSKSMSGESLRAMADFTSSKITCVGTAEAAPLSASVQRRPAVVEGLARVPANRCASRVAAPRPLMALTGA